MDKPLSADLRELRDCFRFYVGSHQRPTIDACRELTTSLSLLAEKADRLEARAADADEMEAIARDLDIVASAAVSPALQRELMAQQRELQRQLDDEEPATRSALAALAMPVGNTNVVVMPISPRPRPFGGGDAA